MDRHPKKPTEAELEILAILWDDGPSTVRFVNDKLNENKEVGYTTTLKIMQIMLDKGLVQREVTERKHIYYASNNKQEIQSLLIERMVDSAFGGSASRLVLQLLGNHRTSRKELAQIKELIRKIERER